MYKERSSIQLHISQIFQNTCNKIINLILDIHRNVITSNEYLRQKKKKYVCLRCPD